MSNKLSGIWAIILAAGESKRMGTSKMLLMINGITMLENVISNISGSEVENILVVLGAEREALTNLISKLPVVYCYNDNYREGMLSSVKCGFRNISSDIKAILVFQGDQPFISPRIINMVIKEYTSSGKGIVIPVYNKKRGHPLMIGKKYFKKIEMLSASEGLRSLAYQFPEDVQEVETDDRGILRGVNTYEEYKSVTNQSM